MTDQQAPGASPCQPPYVGISIDQQRVAFHNHLLSLRPSGKAPDWYFVTDPATGRYEVVSLNRDWEIWQAAQQQMADASPQVALAETRVGRIYLAGPMTGFEDNNFPAFNAKAAALRSQGWHVENPADHGVVEGATWADYLRADIVNIATCEAMYFLPGWEKSLGAKLEHHIAESLGMKRIYDDNAQRAPFVVKPGAPETCIAAMVKALGVVLHPAMERQYEAALADLKGSA